MCQSMSELSELAPDALRVFIAKAFLSTNEALTGGSAPKPPAVTVVVQGKLIPPPASTGTAGGL